jgi:hypothetical protein
MSPGPLARLVFVDLPGAVARWWLAPWPALPTTRDEALQAGVGRVRGPAHLYAGWAHAAHRATPGAGALDSPTAGLGFLLTGGGLGRAPAPPALGPAVSLAGALLVLRAEPALVRERQARARPRRRARRKPPGAARASAPARVKFVVAPGGAVAPAPARVRARCRRWSPTAITCSCARRLLRPQPGRRGALRAPRQAAPARGLLFGPRA